MLRAALQSETGRPLRDRPPEIRLANSYSDLYSAAAMLTTGYHQKRYLDNDDELTRLEVLNSLANYDTYIALVDGRPVKTMGVAFSCPLPMECPQLFEKEMRPLRESGLKIAEVGNLAGSEFNPSHCFHMMSKAFVMNPNVDLFTLTCHPRHERIYRRGFNFSRLSDRILPHPKVKGSKAVALKVSREDFRSSTLFRKYGDKHFA